MALYRSIAIATKLNVEMLTDMPVKKKTKKKHFISKVIKHEFFYLFSDILFFNKSTVTEFSHSKNKTKTNNKSMFVDMHIISAKITQNKMWSVEMCLQMNIMLDEEAGMVIWNLPEEITLV